MIGWTGAFVLAVGLAACGDDATDPRDELRGGVLATFDVADEQFRLWVTNPSTIQQLLALREGSSQATIPIGPVRLGSGVQGHNAPWTWHLDPAETSMAEVTIELCDGRPSFVEQNLDEWIETVGVYCPWGAELAALEDSR
jgi:hypothetical protein